MHRLRQLACASLISLHGVLVSADPDFPIAPFTGGVVPWQDSEGPNCDTGSPDGNFVFDERTVQGSQITEKSWIQKCDDGSTAMRFLLTDNTDPSKPLYSANEYFAKPDTRQDATCEAHGGVTQSTKDDGEATLETDSATGAVISQRTVTSTCEGGDTSEIRTKTLTSASGMKFTYYYAGFHHEVTHVNHASNHGNNGQRGTTTSGSNDTCTWTTTPHYFPDYTRLDTRYVCKLPSGTVVTNVRGQAPPNSTTVTTTQTNNIKTTFNNGTTETISRRTMTLVTNIPAGNSGSCPSRGVTPVDQRDECCRRTVTVTYRSQNFFNGRPTTGEETKTEYHCRCGGYVLKTSGSRVLQDSASACSEKTPEGCTSKTTTNHFTSGGQQVDRTTTTITCDGGCKTTTINSQYHAGDDVDSSKSNEERTRECPITYEGKPATQTEVGTTYNNGSRTLTTTVEGTDTGGFRFGYTQERIATPGQDFLVISTTSLNEISGGGRGAIVELPSPVPCEYDEWSEWTDCATTPACLSTRFRQGKATNTFTCTPSTDLNQERECQKPGCGGIPADCSSALFTNADLCTAVNQTVNPDAVDTLCADEACIAACCMTPPEPPTGAQEQTCGMLYTDDPSLCDSFGEIDPDTLSSPCVRNCDVNCCKKVETPVTGENIDTCFQLLVKNHDLCEGKIVDVDSLDNTCEKDCQINCCTTETPPTGPEATRSCAMWLADNSGLCTDEDMIVDRDSLENPCEKDCDKNCCTAPPRTTCGDVHLSGSLNCGEDRFDESKAYTYCDGTDECKAECCVPKLELPSHTFTHRETISTHTEKTTTTTSKETTTTSEKETTTTTKEETTTEEETTTTTTPTETHFCGDITYYKCETYREDLRCCEHSDKCTGWGNCKCASTACCDKVISGATNPDRGEATDSGEEYHLYCGDMTNAKCTDYHRSRPCCGAGTNKCGDWATEKCLSSAHCCDGTQKATNNDCRRGSRLRRCTG